ncbi:MarR family transcriptional regulator [Sinanaerobacter sp. ZZT-01]|uniref:MarR family winged helix-turn-helix transcriptional regulator n=1 Tax=Sinanaerobacter sp. ZZT-01 TaxID=3111540 RepID=UPI002D770B02|nr:MarR family transcriptional regulator [Sinanaerobacter sp. ZZT-01]WRR92417.1 MarR family transcriptional regulator [Sinanaerobacter sp. ZZT-01]
MDLWRKALELDFRVRNLRVKWGYKMMKKYGLHPKQPMILTAISNMGSCSQRELAEKMHCSPASIGVSIRRLEKSGFVKKETSEVDSRSSRVQLTERGELATKKSKEMIELLTREMLRDFSQEELESYNHLLEKICTNLEEKRLEEKQSDFFDHEGE